MPRRKLGSHPAKGEKRQLKAETIMGEAGAANQTRRLASRTMQARAAKKSVTKVSTTEAIRRVGEYKKASGHADYKPPIHGRKKRT